MFKKWGEEKEDKVKKATQKLETQDLLFNIGLGEISVYSPHLSWKWYSGGDPGAQNDAHCDPKVTAELRGVKFTARDGQGYAITSRHTIGLHLTLLQ